MHCFTEMWTDVTWPHSKVSRKSTSKCYQTVSIHSVAGSQPWNKVSRIRLNWSASTLIIRRIVRSTRRNLPTNCDEKARSTVFLSDYRFSTAFHLPKNYKPVTFKVFRVKNASTTPFPTVPSGRTVVVSSIVERACIVTCLTNTHFSPLTLLHSLRDPSLPNLSKNLPTRTSKSRREVASPILLVHTLRGGKH